MAGTNMSYMYLASLYSHHEWSKMEERFERTEALVADLLKKEIWVYSPIVHCHALAAKHELPTSFDYWQKYNLAMLHKASSFGIFMLPGWDESKGLLGETEIATAMKLPVQHFVPETE